MKMGISVTVAFVLGAVLIYLITLPRAVNGLPGPSPDFSGIENALSEIAANVSR